MTLSYKVIWGPYKNVPPPQQLQQQQQQQQQQQLGPLLDLTAIAAGTKNLQTKSDPISSGRKHVSWLASSIGIAYRCILT